MLVMHTDYYRVKLNDATYVETVHVAFLPTCYRGSPPCIILFFSYSTIHRSFVSVFIVMRPEKHRYLHPFLSSVACSFYVPTPEVFNFIVCWKSFKVGVARRALAIFIVFVVEVRKDELRKGSSIRRKQLGSC